MSMLDEWVFPWDDSFLTDGVVLFDDTFSPGGFCSDDERVRDNGPSHEYSNVPSISSPTIEISLKSETKSN